jgi:saccharopine dehydrogenase-like NADP-dependent oxidoreductase
MVYWRPVLDQERGDIMPEKLKAIILGGAGEMGSRTVEDMAEAEDVGIITVADRDMERAEALKARLAGSSTEIRVRRIDANDHHGMVQAIRGHDVCASAVGPFFIFEPKCVDASIAAGVNYASICDEWEAVEAVIDRFQQPAKDAKVTLITGLGASPGMSNLGIRLLAEGLKPVRKAQISVFQPLDAGGGEAVHRHMLHIISGQVAGWRNNQRVMIPACSESKVVEFPRYGSVRLWNMGHSEPVTVPRTFPDIEEVSFLMGFGRGSSILVTPAKLGMFGGPRRVDATIGIMKILERILPDGEAGWGAIRVDVWGSQDGVEVRRMLCGVGEMRNATGLSLSIGTLMLLRRDGLLTEHGVFAPEACLDPKIFMKGLADRGVQAFEDLAMSKPLA